MPRQLFADDAADALLTRNASLMAEVRRLRAALARVEALCDHADKVSTSRAMSVYPAEVRAALADRQLPANRPNLPTARP